MTRGLDKLLLIMVAAGLLSPFSAAATPPPHSARRWAVIIGISQYADSDIAPLRYAAADAREIRSSLLALPSSGYTRDSIMFLNGEGTPAPTKAAIESAFEEVCPDDGRADTLTVFLSSHGVQSGENAYLILADTTLDTFPESALSFDAFFAIARNAGCKKVMLVIDACHSGMSKRFPRGTMGFALHDQIESAAARGFAILSSSRLGQESYESSRMGHGVFSYFLAAALRGAEGVDRDHDGQLSMQELAIYVERRLEEWGRIHKLVQQPWYVRSGSAAPEVITALIRDFDETGVPLRKGSTIGTIAFSYQIDKLGSAGYAVHGNIDATGLDGERAKVPLLLTLEDGSTLEWKVPIRCGSAWNLLPERLLPLLPSRVRLAGKVFNMEETEVQPVRVLYEDHPSPGNEERE